MSGSCTSLTTTAHAVLILAAPRLSAAAILALPANRHVCATSRKHTNGSPETPLAVPGPPIATSRMPVGLQRLGFGDVPDPPNLSDGAIPVPARRPQPSSRAGARSRQLADLHRLVVIGELGLSADRRDSAWPAASHACKSSMRGSGHVLQVYARPRGADRPRRVRPVVVASCRPNLANRRSGHG